MSSITVGVVPGDPGFTRNRLFDIDATRDCALERFVEARKLMERNGVVCQTTDMLRDTKIDVLVFHNLANEYRDLINVVRANPYVKLLNIPSEPSMVAPLHEEDVLKGMPFDRIMTWNDRLAVLGMPFVKANIGEPVIQVESIPVIEFSKKQFIGCVYSNKTSTDSRSLYAERVRAIQYFSSKQEGVDLYGVGWESSRDHAIKKAYKGVCKRKIDVLMKYKFSICYENTLNESGLITEKIFDCFAAGTVPVYLGASNIRDYIPENCFIDFRDFSDYEELYAFITGLGEDEYNVYINSVRKFLSSPEYFQFTSIRFAEVLYEQVNELMSLPAARRDHIQLKNELLRVCLKHPPSSVKNVLRYLRFVVGLVRMGK